MAALPAQTLAAAPCSLQDLVAHCIGDFHIDSAGGCSSDQLIGHSETNFARSDDLLREREPCARLIFGLYSVPSSIDTDVPKGVVLRSFVFNHIVRHRAQMSVYLHLLDIPVPGMYGPSADDTM
jgi:hypothetical protein